MSLDEPKWRALSGIRAKVRSTRVGRLVWRGTVTAAGAVVIVVGIVLLPLPGPGWLIIFVGLGIWSTEFVWAARLLARIRRLATDWTGWLLRQPIWLRLVVGTIGCALTAAIVVACWYLL
ncbi:MAG TPA: TIGR02611 family protein [Candidatus Acidoferrum sp.]|nr:TIGR02611 family protein [Candidatus Acidoferrum sp.]